MPQKKSSPAKAAAARSNGEKSSGPKTASGKQKSSRNSFKHGATCSNRTPLLLPGENAEQLQLFADAFYDHIRPVNLAEAALVDTLITQVWKTNRINGFEAECLTDAAEDLHASIAEGYESITSARLFALAFQNSAIKAQSPLALRYLIACRNMFRSALSDIVRLRQVKGNPDEPHIPAPRVTPAIQSFCINPDVLPVPDVESMIIKPATGSPEPPSRDFTAPPPQPTQAPEPPPPPQPASEPESQPTPTVTPQTEAFSFDEPPMLPSRDPSGAIYLNAIAKPIMFPNPDYIRNPNAPSKRVPSYEAEDFPDERFNTKLVLFDPRFTHDGRLRNEPNSSANPCRPTAFRRE